jgi:DNA polymerase-4
LLDDSEVASGIRLLGVGVSSLADWIQDDLFNEYETDAAGNEPVDVVVPEQPLATGRTGYYPGQDVLHVRHGPGWVWGSGRGRVTVRFETAATPPGPVRTFSLDDPELSVHEAPAESE